MLLRWSAMAFPKPPIAPMEAKSVANLPAEGGWQFEPKWDGFRCLAFVHEGAVALQSKAGKPLERYFPEMAAALAHLPDCVLDGELLTPLGAELSFAALQMRLHPAETRIRKLAAETPARLMLFDLLHLQKRALINDPLAERREVLQRFHAQHRSPDLRLSPMTTDLETASAWLAGSGGALDGVVAKRRDLLYLPGERAMLKVKRLRTADCVVGGFRYATGKKESARCCSASTTKKACSIMSASPRHAGPCGADQQLESLWSRPASPATRRAGRAVVDRALGRMAAAQPALVAEVRYNHVTTRRFRHGTSFLRWRPDKAPAQCGIDQLHEEGGPGLADAALGES